MPRTQPIPFPTPEQLAEARKAFEANESRDLFYRAATELVRLVDAGMSTLSMSEALAVLLQTWNQSFYRYRGGFKSTDFAEIDAVLRNSDGRLESLRRRSIDSLVESDKEEIKSLFTEFENVLGPVGAAKALHLLAPDFFPLWDRAIAKGYGLALVQGGNAERYARFMAICQAQCHHLESPSGSSLLKRLDEYNYCTFTTGWI